MAMVPVDGDGKLSRVVNLGVRWFIASMATACSPSGFRGRTRGDLANQQWTREAVWLGTNAAVALELHAEGGGGWNTSK
jgi:hypothetical protein